MGLAGFYGWKVAATLGSEESWVLGEGAGEEQACSWQLGKDLVGPQG